MKHLKQETVTFKADRALLKAMDGIPNRSRFIRDAILAALGGECPLCAGTGILTPPQREHWERFAKTHPLTRCPECNQRRLTCRRGG